MFVELVDLVEGVEFDVPQDMNYDDPGRVQVYTSFMFSAGVPLSPKTLAANHTTEPESRSVSTFFMARSM